MVRPPPAAARARRWPRPRRRHPRAMAARAPARSCSARAGEPARSRPAGEALAARPAAGRPRARARAGTAAFACGTPRRSRRRSAGGRPTSPRRRVRGPARASPPARSRFPCRRTGSPGCPPARSRASSRPGRDDPGTARPRSRPASGRRSGGGSPRRGIRSACGGWGGPRTQGGWRPGCPPTHRVDGDCHRRPHATAPGRGRPGWAPQRMQARRPEQLSSLSISPCRTRF